MNGRLVERAALNPAQRGEMLALLRSHFEGVTVEQFERDLDEKSWVVLIEDIEGRIRGFSTLVLWHETFGNRSLPIVFSGDTIMDRAAWGTTTLLRAWFNTLPCAKQAGRSTGCCPVPGTVPIVSCRSSGENSGRDVMPLPRVEPTR